jgi:uncharacterized protein (TIGR03435 family)
MFRTLLKDRFGLQMHKVSHEGKVFNLQVDGAASKMHDNPTGPGMNIPVVPVGVGQFRGQGLSMAYFCWLLGQQIQDKERPVIDETGLTGTYDFKLSFLPDSTDAVAAVKAHKLRCPEDVSVIGFDGLSITGYTEPMITTVVQPSYQLGHNAAELLLDRIQGATDPPRHIVLETELRIRASTHPINAQR